MVKGSDNHSLIMTAYNRLWLNVENIFQTVPNHLQTCEFTKWIVKIAATSKLSWHMVEPRGLSHTYKA